MRHREGWFGYRPPASPTRKPPGRLATYTRRKARLAAPYAAGLVVALILDVALHMSGRLFCAATAVAATLAAGRLLDARDIRRAGGRRAARQRRKVQGLASWREWRRHLSLTAARRRARVTRPQTPGRLPVAEAGVNVGRRHGRPVVISHEDAVLVIGPPRSGKSAAVGNWVWDAPGACLVTSTRTDLYKHTAAPRRERGRVRTLNPGGHGGIPTDFAWSPLDGCENPDEAEAAGITLMAAAPQDKAKDDYWTDGAAELLKLYFHAAILGGASIREARSWVADPTNLDALTILDNHEMAADGWGDTLASILLGSDDDDEKRSIRNAALSALRWLDNPAMTAVACASPDQWFDVEEFIEDGTGTIYLIGANKSLAFFFAAFAGRMFRAARRLAEASPGGRLDPPLTLALDEAALICPVPLHEWSAEAGGAGITLLAAVQSPSQLRDRWGENGHDTIYNNMSKLIFGGLSLHKDLQDISGACGERDTWTHVKGETGKKTRQPGKEPTVPLERIRKMDPGMALFLHRGVRPFFTHLKPVWDRRDYIPATVSPASPRWCLSTGRSQPPLSPGTSPPPRCAAPRSPPWPPPGPRRVSSPPPIPRSRRPVMARKPYTWARKPTVARRAYRATADRAKDRAADASRKLAAKLRGHKVRCPHCGRTFRGPKQRDMHVCRRRDQRTPRPPRNGRQTPAKVPFKGREQFHSGGKRYRNRLEFNDAERQRAEKEDATRKRAAERDRRTQAANARNGRGGQPNGTPKTRTGRTGGRADGRTSAERKAEWKAQRMQHAAGRMDRAGNRLPHTPSPRKVRPRTPVPPRVRT